MKITGSSTLLAMATACVLKDRTGVDHDPTTLLAETVDDWPEQLKEQHKKFVNEYLDDLWKVLVEQLRPYATKMHRIPTERDIAERWA